jgi:hypothetical protein
MQRLLLICRDYEWKKNQSVKFLHMIPIIKHIKITKYWNWRTQQHLSMIRIETGCDEGR